MTVGTRNHRVTILILGLVGCSSGGPPDGGTMGPSVTTVQFVYMASTATDPAVAALFPGCVQVVGTTHIHPEWRSFARINMTAVGADRWEIVFSQVPVGMENRIRISDPNACATDPNGASTQNVLANGILLTSVVSTPGNGLEPGLAFSVDLGGQVMS